MDKWRFPAVVCKGFEEVSQSNSHVGVVWAMEQSYSTLTISPSSFSVKIDKGIVLFPFNKDEGYKLNMNPNQDEIWKHSKLSRELNFPKAKSDDDYYPIYYNGQFIDSYSLKVVVDRERTGFE